MRGVRLWAAGAATAVIVAVAGCGGGSSGEVTKSVRAWTDAMSRGDGKQACARMTGAAARELARFGPRFGVFRASAGCTADVRHMAMKLNPNALRQMHDADVDAVRIEGSTAVVRMVGGGPNEVVLRRVGGSWRVDQAFRRGWRLVGAPSFGLGG